MTDEPNMVCAKCGSDKIGCEYTSRGSATVHVGIDKDGKPYVDHRSGEYEHDTDYDNFCCASCNATWYPLAKGLAPEHVAGIDLNPGEIVVLPDGLKAVIEAVDPDENTFTVRGWHETFLAGEGHRLAAA